MQYVISRDEETGEIDLIGRFKEHAIGEIWRNGKWVHYSYLISELHDGLLENITEAEAKKIIAEMKTPQLQAA
jgi:hypothetical protein